MCGWWGVWGVGEGGECVNTRMRFYLHINTNLDLLLINFLYSRPSVICFVQESSKTCRISEQLKCLPQTDVQTLTPQITLF